MACAPAGHEGVARVVGKRFALYPQPERSDAEWDAWWGDYYATLEDLPEGAIEAGMQAWVKQLDAEFMPRPGKLRELALQTPNRAAKAYERALAGVNHDNRPKALAAPEPARPARDQAHADEVAEMLADFRAKIVRPEPRKPLPPLPVKVDEFGISDAMRRHQAEEG